MDVAGITSVYTIDRKLASAIIDTALTIRDPLWEIQLNLSVLTKIVILAHSHTRELNIHPCNSIIFYRFTWKCDQ